LVAKNWHSFGLNKKNNQTEVIYQIKNIYKLNSLNNLVAANVPFREVLGEGDASKLKW